MLDWGPMNVNIDESWRQVLQNQFDSPYFAELTRFVRAAYAKGIVYPPGRFIFEAFNRTPFDKVKVVILGQDPYHGPNQAHGLCFSVQPGVAVPPSLFNMYKELEDEYKTPFLTRNGDLSAWADQGVLLLNATLTVEAGHAGSHQGHGWETFTDAVVKALATRREHLVFMLWGSYAQRKGPASRPRNGPPLAALRLPRLLRLRALPQGRRLPARTRYRARALVRPPPPGAVIPPCGGG